MKKSFFYCLFVCLSHISTRLKLLISTKNVNLVVYFLHSFDSLVESLQDIVFQGKEVKANPSVSTKDDSGGWTTSSTLSGYKVTSLKVKSQVEAVCEAVNPQAKEIVSGKHILTLVSKFF